MVRVIWNCLRFLVRLAAQRPPLKDLRARDSTDSNRRHPASLASREAKLTYKNAWSMLCVSANSIGSPRSNPRIGARRIEKKNEKNRSRGNVLKLSHRCIAYHVRLTDTASISPPGPKNGASQIENKRNMRDSEDVPNRLIASNCLDVSDCLTLVNGGINAKSS